MNEEIESSTGDVVFVVNLAGRTESVNPSHPAAALARNGHEGWRLASPAEIRQYFITSRMAVPADVEAAAKATER